MKDFDLNLLRVVVALYDAGSVGRAAQALGMSQPAMSAALARLRKAFGEPLFVRTARGMSPTARAHALAAGAREVLARIADDVLSEASFDPASASATFTIAMSDVGEMVFLPKILESLQREAPHAVVRSVSLPPARLEQALESGEADLAVGYFPDLKSSAFFQQRLFTHRFVCLLRADHPIRGRRLTLEQFLSLGHAVVRAEGRSQEIFEKYLERKKIARRIVLLTPHFMSIPTIIGKTDLVVTLPHAIGLFFSQAGANIKVMEPPLPIPRIELRQHWHRNAHHDPKNKWLRRLVAGLFTDASDEWPYPF
ncbi:MAG: LysR family transcriptional regulator [Rhodocyclales bacterium]|nr:MAG: LysR family transcriptional regulator [Rhodocyclales bacterium]